MLYVTHSRLLRDFQALGLRPGDAVMLHASVKAVGWVVGGPDVVLRALRECLTPDGTLMMGLSWEDAPDLLESWDDEDRKQAYLAEMPPFDPRTSRADLREMSILAEYLRTTPGALRSDKPFGYAALGKHAAYLTAGQPHNYRDGAGSPLEKLCALEGRVLLLGAPLETVTLLHYAENLARVPDKRVVRYKLPVLKDGAAVWEEFEEFDTTFGIVDWDAEEDYFETITKGFIREHAIPVRYVGGAPSYLLEAAPLVRFAVEWMERSFTRSLGDAARN